MPQSTAHSAAIDVSILYYSTTTVPRARAHLPAQVNQLKCARTAATAFPSTATPRRTNHAGLWLGLALGIGFDLEVRVGMVAAVGRGRTKTHRRDSPSKKLSPFQSRDKTLRIETASAHTRTSEEGCLRGQICRGYSTTAVLLLLLLLLLRLRLLLLLLYTMFCRHVTAGVYLHFLRRFTGGAPHLTLKLMAALTKTPHA